MKSDHDDKILNAFLEELLADRRPPNLTAEILRKNEERTRADSAPIGTPALELPAEVDLVEHRTVEQLAHWQTRAGGDSRRPTRRMPTWAVLTVAASLLVALLSITTVLIVVQQRQNRTDVVHAEPTGPNAAPRQPDAPQHRQPQTGENIPIPWLPGDQLADSGFTNSLDPPDAPTPAGDRTQIVLPPRFVRSNNLPSIEPALPAEAASMIDQNVRAGWEAEGIDVAARLDDRQWTIRLTSRLLGEMPDASDLERLLQLVRNQGREALVSRLLTAEPYRARFIDHWAHVLAMRLLGLPSHIQFEDSNVDDLQSYLAEAMRRGTPWDQVAYELISAVGTTDSSSPEHNAATGLQISVAKRFGTRSPYSSAHLSKVFLGVDQQCIQCHDSFDDARLVQADFWKTQSLLTQMRIEAGTNGSIRLVNRDYVVPGAAGNEAPVVYTDVAGSPQVAFPAVNGQAAPSRSGLIAMFDRRTFFAEQVSRSPNWPLALVDHVWTELLNVPITASQGHAGQNVNTHLQQLHHDLAEQLAANQFDISFVISAIALSEPFALGVGTEKQMAQDNPHVGAVAWFGRYYLQSPSLRNTATTLEIVANAYQASQAEVEAMRGVLAQRFQPAAQPENPPAVTIQESLPVADEYWAASPQVGQILRRIVASEMTDRQKFEHLVVAAFGRAADEEEWKLAEQTLRASDDPHKSLQDIWWALLNSFEYQFPPAVK